MTQQARNLVMDLGERVETLRFLIHDRDPVFTAAFAEVFKTEGMQIAKTLPQTPRMNAVCERVIGTLLRELLDRILIVGQQHLALVLRDYLNIRAAQVPPADLGPSGRGRWHRSAGEWSGGYRPADANYLTAP